MAYVMMAATKTAKSYEDIDKKAVDGDGRALGIHAKLLRAWDKHRAPKTKVKINGKDTEFTTPQATFAAIHATLGLIITEERQQGHIERLGMELIFDEDDEQWRAQSLSPGSVGMDGVFLNYDAWEIIADAEIDCSRVSHENLFRLNINPFFSCSYCSIRVYYSKAIQIGMPVGSSISNRGLVI